MNLFLDTSSLFKLYYQESETEAIEAVFQNYNVSIIFLSDITRVEFFSTVWKKVRVKDITDSMAQKILKAFESDINKYNFVPLESLIVEQAKNLISKYGNSGLRSLDSLQLSTALSLKDVASLFVTSDKLLNSFFIQEGYRF